jgi:NifB/MoaA-like Fe-S oxidoreductase
MGGHFKLLPTKMYNKEIIYEDDIVQVGLTYERDPIKGVSIPFIHFTYYKPPTPNNIRTMRKVVSEWRKEFKEKGNTCFFSISKNYHFIHLIAPDYTIIGEFDNPDGSGEAKDLIMWSL